MLRLPIGLISCGAMLVAQVSPGFAQSPVVPPAQPAAFSPVQDATPSPAIVDAFTAYPKGGDELSKRIEDLIVGDPKLAPGLAKYVQTTPGLSKEQKLAAFRGLAGALNRMGVQAADMPVYKAPPAPVEVPPEFPWWPHLLFLAALIGGGICIAVCREEERLIIPSVSP